MEVDAAVSSRLHQRWALFWSPERLLDSEQPALADPRRTHWGTPRTRDSNPRWLWPDLHSANTASEVQTRPSCHLGSLALLRCREIHLPFLTADQTPVSMGRTPCLRVIFAVPEKTTHTQQWHLSRTIHVQKVRVCACRPKGHISSGTKHENYIKKKFNLGEKPNSRFQSKVPKFSVSNRKAYITWGHTTCTQCFLRMVHQESYDLISVWNERRKTRTLIDSSADCFRVTSFILCFLHLTSSGPRIRRKRRLQLLKPVILRLRFSVFCPAYWWGYWVPHSLHWNNYWVNWPLVVSMMTNGTVVVSMFFTTSVWRRVALAMT